MHTTDEQALVAAAQKGDKQAFGVLYEAYLKAIYTFIYYKTHHKETAEDVTSLAFIKAYDNLTSYSPDKGTFSAWLYRIARNAVFDHFRAVKPMQDVEDAWDLAGGDDVLRDTHHKTLLEDVQTYLKTLSAEQREIITLRLWQEKSFAEIAEILGKSEASCKMMFGRTISKLRETMPPALLAILLSNTLFS